MTKIAVAMSGGVDSSVMAALLKKEGHEVIGLTMLVVPEDEKTDGRVPAMAQAVAKTLDIPHYVIDLRECFADRIISEFCIQYGLGKTPNPCVRCNRFIKFGSLFEKARELGAEVMATGHYARIEQRKSDGSYLLKKGIDHKRDQSYFLYDLTQEQLSRTLFTLGHISKDVVRRKAEEMSLPVSRNVESREICFIPDNDYPRFLQKKSTVGTVPGGIVDSQGSVVGEHQGIIHYTIGQRHGLGIAFGKPLYVVAIDAKTNTVIVGDRQDLFSSEFIASGVNWISVAKPELPLTAWVRIRYLHPESQALLTPLGDDRVRVRFQQPQSAITPGQAAVFYDGDLVVGGGTIEEVVHRPACH